MKEYFVWDERLGIEVPHVEETWESLAEEVQQHILLKWEGIRGAIPDRIKELEHMINQKQHRLGHESNFEISCVLNRDIAELASIINDLWLWYRTNQDLAADKSHT
ncbi:radical SAM protein [Ectobacillus ponti]|uniref:Radical SAM protein n=1 Tax=Ectobacillus ponti TaxID=2961894 RepID=A0AA42BNA2_9BACI|nr:radical SAM protein [Ectobacillus ponti]MCP8967452.1 radical SAM protein [Ectobacillus ponti]